MPRARHRGRERSGVFGAAQEHLAGERADASGAVDVVGAHLGAVGAGDADVDAPVLGAVGEVEVEAVGVVEARITRCALLFEDIFTVGVSTTRQKSIVSPLNAD